jgi:hypothetical protein
MANLFTLLFEITGLGLAPAREGLDDDHAAAAARTRTRQHALLMHCHGCGRLRFFDGGWRREQRARSREVASTIGFGKQSVVPDAVQALGQNVDEEAADELVGCEGHPFVTGRPVEPIVLVAEGDAILVGGDEAAIGDSDAVGVARQIVQNLLGPRERSFAVDDPLALPQRF